ncbi:MAG: chorismate synthase [SAR324 cluster bacterium]|nr:chorismate synthase [SAR324 cluster bacterium]
MGDTLGKNFRITTWGESHGGGVGVVIDGCPAGLPISAEEIQFELDRRKPGQSRITTQRKESDTAHLLSGIFEGLTLGTAISIMVKNEDARSNSYEELKDLYRPSHADYTYEASYGLRNWKGGGRASARETIGRVAAGAIAKKILSQHCNIETLAYVEQIHDIKAKIDRNTVDFESIENNMVRCPDQEVVPLMIKRIEEARKSGDSVGGIIGAVVRNTPPGFGDPVFDKLTADFAKALMSLPATRGVEFGLGFDSVALKGSEHNDPFIFKDQQVRTRTNFSGGIQGGISNGEDIHLRVAFKPTATINFEQDTITRSGKETKLKAKGRHDPCVLPRAVPMVEAMINLVLVDHFLRSLLKKNQSLSLRNNSD